ncbi:hypothetical protein [Mycobacterium simiae]|uniref:hypothetical protein n=1 Tax=Mycobacterium simiae TaxID=1784 RepID=UPI0015933307|nr:hypothetical protein [Mycobacterium simiae]
MPDRSIVIIGANPAGISAALSLKDKKIGFRSTGCRGHGVVKTARCMGWLLLT